MRPFLIFFIGQVAWTAVGPGSPLGWASLVPIALWIAWLAGELHGEGCAWTAELRRREARMAQVRGVARMLRDPEFVRVHDGTRADAMRERATWN